MENQALRFRQVQPDSRVTERFPDGSIAAFDKQTRDAYFLNASAASAFEACREQADVTAIARSMQAALGTLVTRETALAALIHLEEKQLVEPVDSESVAVVASRRSVLKAMGTAAGILAPLVLAMTASEQKAYAAGVGTGAPSDIRLKEDIRMLTRLFGLNVYTFRFTGSPNLRIGLMAQEVYELHPEAVIPGGPDPHTQPWKIDYAMLVRRLDHPQAYVLQELALANS